MRSAVPLARSVRRAGARCSIDGAPEEASAFYRCAFDQDPLAEAFHRRLMPRLRDLGCPVRAVEASANLKSLMLAATGGPPSAETGAIDGAVRGGCDAAPGAEGRRFRA